MVHLGDAFEPHITRRVKKDVQHISALFQNVVRPPTHQNTRPFLCQLLNGFCLLQEDFVLQGQLEGSGGIVLEQVCKKTAPLLLSLRKMLRMDSAAFRGFLKQRLVINLMIMSAGDAFVQANLSRG